MKKLLEKDIYETPVLMEISPVSFVAVQGGSGDGGLTNPEIGDDDDLGGDDDI